MYIYIYIYDVHIYINIYIYVMCDCNALVVPFQQLLEGPMEVLFCEHVNDLRHSFYHLLNCLIPTASKLRE